MSCRYCRARKFCWLSYAGSRFRNGQTAACRPSRFLGDIDPAYLRLSTNDILGASAPKVRPTVNYSASMAGSARSLNSLRSGGGRMPAPASPQSPRGYSSVQRPPAAADSRGAVATSSSSTGNYSIHSSSELKEGMKIEHAKFGVGTITVIDSSGLDARITVEFDSTDTRTLMLKFAKFAIVG